MSTHYLVGHPGTGKTTRLVQQLSALLNAGVRPDRILVLVPQESGARRFQAALAPIKRRLAPHIETFSGLIQRHVGLFFPRIAPQAGFGAPNREPIWVNVESAQYLLDQLIAPHLDQFGDLRVSRARLVIQILDNLNRAALSGFPLATLAERLGAAWRGAASRLRAYSAAQEVALAFRQFCLRHGLVDFSLSVELFRAHLLSADFYRAYVTAQYRHILADNIEEGAPVVHDFLALLLETAESAWLVEDDPGGYRLNLGAEPASARALRARCAHVVHIEDARLATDAPPSPAHFAQALMAAITTRQRSAHAPAAEVAHSRYWVDMIEATVARIAELVAQGAPANAIAVIAPVVEDVLQFELAERLRAHQIGLHTLRPSRPLIDQPLVRALLTLARLAHPEWGDPPTPQAVARALAGAIAGLDVLRAQRIVEASQRVARAGLAPIEDAALWARVGPEFRPRYETLCRWLSAAAQLGLPLDVFWERLRAEVLSQAGFALAEDAEAAAICDKLVASARAFRRAVQFAGLQPDGRADQAYIDALTHAPLAAEYAPERLPEVPAGHVLLAPAYTYLSDDYRSRYQFWLDVRSTSWHQRFHQPLTHPYVLSRYGQPRDGWTDADEQQASRDLLARVVGGLAFRCSERIYLMASALNISGQEDYGMLASALERMNGWQGAYAHSEEGERCG
jgi:hypothetical protein